ncbi:MAG: 40S ribosomal protein S20 [Amphiamblys sp. WSBS2006]|nr:MAG: 40S ribosomal protein S20 [Amphiamblys sp. WSBS2006]
MDAAIEKKEEEIKQHAKESFVEEEKEGKEESELSIRVLITGISEKTIKKHCNDILKKAQEFGLATSKPGTLPLKKAAITTRKTPCGQGSKTWDKYELRVYRMYLDLQCSMGVLRELVSEKPEPRVKIVILMRDE